jgi:type I restriction enzyme R subunit
VLLYKNENLVVIEAKAEGKSHTEGLQQAKKYGELLNVRFVASTNGKHIRWVDMITGEEKDIDEYPSPNQVWAQTFKFTNEWRDNFQEIPFCKKGGGWALRYYQSVAVNKTLDAVANNNNRILLTLSTGSGKTDIAFQIAWKLFKSKWTLSKDRIRSPRILFLADRNILADQAYNCFESYNVFSDGALIRLRSNQIKQRCSVPQNASVFFTIFQTLMRGEEDNLTKESHYKSFPLNYFDVIFIDECHRGGANDESEWRDILEYFFPALQIGLTATPKRSNNINTYSYFGDPVYTYSLKMGINDGFLTPYKLINYTSNVDNYILKSDDIVLQGDADVGKSFSQDELNSIVLIKQREEGRVVEFLKNINSGEKTIVFCANQERARFIRDLFNVHKKETAHNYCVRVTASDGPIGEQMLRLFQDNEKIYPTILTTSHKLSTGIDASDIRHIVFFRQAHDIIEFKQIIGRGTRLNNNKYYFTIHDFTGTSNLFNDPEWDGDPLQFSEYISYDIKSRSTTSRHVETNVSTMIQLSNDAENSIIFLQSLNFLDTEGQPISFQEFLTRLFAELSSFFTDENELRKLWSIPETRRTLLSGLAQKGFDLEQLFQLRNAINADECDIYDILAYIKFNSKLIHRVERANNVRISCRSQFIETHHEFIDLILQQYVNNDFTELDQENLPELIKLRYHTVQDGYEALGSKDAAIYIFRKIQINLYE